MLYAKSFLVTLSFIGIILCALFAGHFIDYNTKCIFYSISLTLKNILLVVLPFIIIVFLVHSLISIGRGAYLFVIFIIPLIIFSNFLATCTGYFAGQAWLQLSCFKCSVTGPLNSLVPLWSCALKPWLSNDVAMMIGIVIGVIASFLQRPVFNNFSAKCFAIVNFMLNKVFLPISPLLIAGFVLNLQESGVLSLLILSYGKVLLGFVIVCLSYIFILYGIGNLFKISRWLNAIQNMIPAMVAGFSAMSSAAALPLTLIAAKKNVGKAETRLQDHETDEEQNLCVVDVVIPMTVNVHLIGDCFAIPLFALAVMVTFKGALPDWLMFLEFALYFVMAKFAVAAVPGGGILVMLPILENHLHFTPEMLSIMMALYLLFDPFITSGNILGNGAFALICDKVMGKFRLMKRCT